MGQCVSQFCQQQDQMILSAQLGMDSSTKSPQQIYNQNRSKNDYARLQRDDESDGEYHDDEDMELTQMIQDLKGSGMSQNIQNLMNQKYNMELQSISMLEQAQVSYIPKTQNVDMDFSNNYFSIDQFNTSFNNINDAHHHFQKRNSQSKSLSHMISSFTSGNNDHQTPNGVRNQHQQRQNTRKHSAVNKKINVKKRQFLVFRLPRTQYLLSRLEVVPSLNAQEIQDIYFLKDLYDLQKMVSSNLIINITYRRRFSNSNISQQYFHQNPSEKTKDNHMTTLFFQKLRIVMNDILINDLSFLSILEQQSTIQKLSIHIQSSTSTDFLGMILIRFKDVQELSLRFDVSFVLSSDFLAAACSLSQLIKLKLVFNCLCFINHESTKKFYDQILCTFIGKQFPDRYYINQPASASSIPTSIGLIVQQQQKQQLAQQIIQLQSIKLQFILTDCQPVVDLLLNKVLKGISLPNMSKISIKLHTFQDAANIQILSLSQIFLTCTQLGNQSAINFNKLKKVNFGITVSSTEQPNSEINTARFNLSSSNHIAEDDAFGIKSSARFNQINSITDISPSQTIRQGQYKKTLVEEVTSIANYTNQNILQSVNNQNNRCSNLGIEMNSSVNSYNPQINLNMNSNNGSALIVNSMQDTKSLSKNYIAGYLKSIDLKKSSKITLRDESGLCNINQCITQLRASQNIVQLNLQFCITSENSFQSLMALLQSNSNSIKKLQLELDKKILISLYDDHKLFAIISKMQSLLSFIVNYKTKEPIFHQIISAPKLILYFEYKNVFNQSPMKVSANRQQTRIVNQNISHFIKNIGQAKNLLHIQSPDFIQLVPAHQRNSQNNETRIQNILILKLLSQVKKRLAVCYLAIHPSLKQFYVSNYQLNSPVECSITLGSPSILQNQFLIDLSEFY